MSWKNLKDANPDLAAYGEQRFDNGVAYIGTVDKNSVPRVHPVTPLLRDDRLFVYMHPTSPKAKDLQRHPHYALHCAVEDNEGGAGEFYVRGTARLHDDDTLWTLVRPERDIAEMRETFILFELDVDHAFSMTYSADGNVVSRWRSDTR